MVIVIHLLLLLLLLFCILFGVLSQAQQYCFSNCFLPVLVVVAVILYFVWWSVPGRALVDKLSPSLLVVATVSWGADYLEMSNKRNSYICLIWCRNVQRWHWLRSLSPFVIFSDSVMLIIIILKLILMPQLVIMLVPCLHCLRCLHWLYCLHRLHRSHYFRAA